VSKLYGSALSYAPSSVKGARDGSREVPTVMADVVVALYEYPRSKVRVVGAAVPDFEIWCLRLWCQQLGALRENFQFCSYASEDRSFINGAFDLQYTPRRGVIASQWSDEEVLVSASSAPNIANYHRWITATYADLAYPVSEMFGSDFALGDVQRGREAFAASTIFGHQGLWPRDGAELEYALVRVNRLEVDGGEDAVAPLMAHVRRVIGMAKPDDLRSNACLDFIQKHIGELWATLPIDVLRESFGASLPEEVVLEILRDYLKRGGQSFKAINEIANKIQWPKMRQLLLEDIESGARAASEIPSIYSKPELWRDREIAREVVVAFERGGKMPKRALATAVRVGAPDLVETLLSCFEREVVDFVVEQVRRSHGNMDAALAPWIPRLRGHEEAVAMSIARLAEGRSRVAAQFVVAFDHDHLQHNEGSDCWIGAFDSSHPADLAEFPSLAYFLCARALSKKTPDPCALLTVSLEAVCMAYSRKWSADVRRLDPYLPPSLYFWGEGLQTKLLRATLFLAMDYRFTLDQLFHLVQSEQLFEEFLGEARHVVGGVDYLIGIAESGVLDSSKEIGGKWQVFRHVVEYAGGAAPA